MQPSETGIRVNECLFKSDCHRSNKADVRPTETGEWVHARVPCVRVGVSGFGHYSAIPTLCK